MLTQKITVEVQANVAGPKGKLRAGTRVELEDNAHTRLLVKSGMVALIDPPSLDPSFLEKGGYELQEGYSYTDLKAEAEKAKAKKVVKVEPKKVEKKKAQKKVETVPAALLGTPKAEESKEPEYKEAAPEEEKVALDEEGAPEEGHPEASTPESTKLSYGEVVSSVDILETGHPEARDEYPASE